MTVHNLTFPEARTVVLCAVEDFLSNLPASITPEGYALAAIQLDLKLSFWLGGRVHYVHDVADTLEELEQLDNGDHPALALEGGALIDEGGNIRDALNTQIEDALRDVVNSAGIYAERGEMVAA